MKHPLLLFLFRAHEVMWVQEGRTALELARLDGPGSEWENAESAYPAVIELLTDPSAVEVSVCIQTRNGEQWGGRSEILQKMS